MRARELDDVGQPGEVALHREDPVRDHELALTRLARGQAGLELLHRRVGIDHLARRARETDRVDDRRVVQLVREDHRTLVDERRDRRLVRVPARDVRERGFRAGEVGELALELQMRLERPADEAYGAGAGAVSPQPFNACLDHLRPCCEPEVVVRREDDDLTASGHLHDSPLRRDERVEPLIRPRLAERVELGADCAVEACPCCGRHP